MGDIDVHCISILSSYYMYMYMVVGLEQRKLLIDLHSIAILISCV